MTNPSPPDPQTEAPPRCYRHPDRETWIRCQRCSRPICPDCMRPAAVGFHCPECVAEGARTQRQPRTVGGGLVPSAAGRMTMVLIGINVLVWLAAVTTGGGGSQTEPPSRFFVDGAMLTDTRCFADVGCLTGVDQGAYWRLLTSTFLHLQLFHILANMYALWIFGPALERLLGYARFTALYLTCGLAGSVAVLWLASEQFTLGASGAVFGLFGAAILILRSRGMDITSLLVLLGINLVITFAVPSISWQGHLGGLAAGLLLGLVFAYAPRDRRNVVQGLAFGGMWVAMIVLVAVHAAG